MTTRAHFRKAALQLPHVSESNDSGTLTFRVPDGIFARLKASGVGELFMTDEHAERAMARAPTAEPLLHEGSQVGVSVRIEDINGMVLNALLERAWLSHAPEQAVKAREGARSGVAPEAGDDALPPGIGKPATRALLSIGITKLSAVANLSEVELLAQHGIGQKAVRILQEQLHARGLELAG